MATTMEIVVNGVRNTDVSYGSSGRTLGAIPAYRGGVTMTIMSSPLSSGSAHAPVITVDPNARGGVPCVSGGQWPITHILEKLAAGVSPQRLVQDYPDLTLADIRLALDAAAWVMRDPAIDWSALNLPGMVDYQHEMQAWQSLSDDALGLIDNPSRD